MLGSAAWFGALPSDVRTEILAAGTLRTVAARQYLYEEEGEPFGLHGVTAGCRDRIEREEDQWRRVRPSVMARGLAPST